jgi:hypothetical protein
MFVRRSEDSAENISGVREVHNDLRRVNRGQETTGIGTSVTGCIECWHVQPPKERATSVRFLVASSSEGLTPTRQSNVSWTVAAARYRRHRAI